MKRVHKVTLTGLLLSLTTIAGVLAESESTVPTYSQNLEDRASSGNVIAQYQLGRVYSYGKGVQQDIVKALDWYQKAANQGDKDAEKKVNEVIATLQQGPDKTPEQIGADTGKSEGKKAGKAIGEQIWDEANQ